MSSPVVMYSKGGKEIIEKQAKMEEDYQLMFSSGHFYLLNKVFWMIFLWYVLWCGGPIGVSSLFPYIIAIDIP